MAKILLTGGAGYVGSHCVKLLTDQGHDVTVLDNLSRGRRRFVRSSNLVVGDIRDRRLISSLFKSKKFDAVMHFAAYAYVGESVSDPLLYWDNNMTGSLVLFEEAIQSGVKKIVFSSTCAVYGEVPDAPIREEQRKLPINPYGQTKLAVETVLDNLEISHGVQSVRFRYFNAAGADPSSGLGEMHQPETHLIPLAIGAAIKTYPKLIVFGNDFATKDGTPIRDYIHVNDLARAHVLGLDYLLDGAGTEVFNLGTGKGNSVLEIIYEIQRQTEKPLPYEVSSRRIGDPAVLIADATKVASVLGWKAKYDLERIISDAIAWHAIQ